MNIEQSITQKCHSF